MYKKSKKNQCARRINYKIPIYHHNWIEEKQPAQVLVSILFFGFVRYFARPR